MIAGLLALAMLLLPILALDALGVLCTPHNPDGTIRPRDRSDAAVPDTAASDRLGAGWRG